MAAAGNHTATAQEKGKAAQSWQHHWHAAQSLQEPACLKRPHPLPKGAATAGNQSQGLITAM